jgi:biopolymer transport protein ExbB
MFDLFKHAGMTAWPLGAASVLALAIILERVFTLTRIKTLEDRAFLILQMALERGDLSALRDDQIRGAPITQVIDSLTELRGASHDAVQHAGEIALSMQRLRLRRYLGTLATIGSTAPFIGLFGTVLGIMAAFAGMSQAGLSGERMAAGISEALSATALGLLVAVPSVIAYNYFTGRVQATLLHIQGHVARLVPLLNGASEESRASRGERERVGV